MFNSLLKFAFVVLALTPLALSHSATAQEIINLHSGNGDVGSLDSKVTFISTGDGAIGPFSSADFAAARNGASAFIVAPGGPYVTSLFADPSAQWVAADAGFNAKSALYAYTFQVNTNAIKTASLELHFAVDNFLGQSTVPGLYINEKPLAATNQIGNFDKQYDYTNSDIGSLLKPGVNTLYFYQYDEGVVAASLFSVKINITSTVPAPSRNLLWQNQISADVVFWQMSGTAKTGAGYLSQGVGPVWQVVGYADLTGDGKPELIWQNQTTGDVYYWQFSGTTHTGGGYLAQGVPLDWKVVAVSDITGDGQPDLIWQNKISGDVVYWQMNGITPSAARGYLAQGVDSDWRVVGFN